MPEPEEKKNDPFEALTDRIGVALAVSESKTVETIAKVLEDHGVRVILLAVSDNMPHPQIERTVTLQDLVVKTVTQTTEQMLRKVGIPDMMIRMVVPAAGELAVQYLQQMGKKKPEKPEEPAEPAIGSRSKWTPRHRRG